MKKVHLGLLCIVLAVVGCDHSKHTDSSQSSASVANTDSVYTGESYTTMSSAKSAPPRALPVTQSPTSSPKAVPVASVPETPTPNHVPARSPVPDDVSTPPAAPMPALGANPTPEAPPASVPDTHTESSKMEMTPPTPVVATPPPPMSDTEAQKQVVVLETSLGRMVIELDDVSAPRTCGNFRKLVSEGFYNHTIFHRVIPNFMIQGGDPNSKTTDTTGLGQGDPGYTLPAEIRLKHTSGAVAMARLPDASNPERASNGSQFYICVAPCPSLDGQYTVFAHVIQGMDTAIAIASQPRDQHDNPTTRIEIEARLETKKQALQEN